MRDINFNNYDVIIVGCGLSGAVIAERFASILDKKVCILDRRSHIGGNCYDYIDENGILINKYGAHLFHTNYEDVWNYITQFGEWERWEHKVVGIVDEKIVPIPVNITTVNMLCGENIKTEKEMELWLKNNQIKFPEIKNSEEMAKSRVGNKLYEKIFYNYTYKQWNKYPSELHPEILSRIPIRSNFEDRYFTDKYQALPKEGYTSFFKSLLKHNNIECFLEVDFHKIKDKIPSDKTIVYTGPIDEYFSNIGYERLEYRSINFDIKHIKNMNYYQVNSVVNYLESDVDFTRIVEYKHFLNQKSPHTTIVIEYTTDKGEPYYPVLNERNLTLYEKYKNLAEKESNIHFLGRLANYKYFNMDEAIKNSLDYFYNFLNTFKGGY
jgi:UDP-galactopyranose mutase